MRLDMSMMAPELAGMATFAAAAEEAGFDTLWTTESGNDPFLPLVIAAEHTRRVRLGTAVAIAFARSPMTVAYTAWDLARLSKGRFILGLGTQVKGHIERRYGMPWMAPAPRMREYIESLRAIFKCWNEGGTSLSYQGKYYRFSLMTPFFTPPRHDYWRVPIHLAGLNPLISQLAGEICDGFIVHPFHTAKFIRERVLPNIATGLARGGRKRSDIRLSSLIFVILGESEQERAHEREAIRRQLAFYGSTRTYQSVLDIHGWGEVTLALNRLAAKGDWDAMAREVSDEMVDTFAITGTADTIADLVKERYEGLLDNVSFYHWRQVPTGKLRRIIRDFNG